MKKILKTSTYLIAPIIFLALFLLPIDIELNQKIFLSIFSFVISLWLLTDLPLFISGILGVCLSVIFNVTTLDAAFAPFANPIIFLFMGGFLLAKALEITNLDQSLASFALNISWARKSPKRTVFVFLMLCFILSMWISNTAAVAMLLPLGLGLLKRLELNFGIKDEKFKELLLISLAYSATLGGNVTPIGSPPNIIAIGFVQNLTGHHISFLQWMVFTLPISLALFYLVFFRATKDLKKVQDFCPVENENNTIVDYRSFSKEQKVVIMTFFATVFLWIAPSIISLLTVKGSPVDKILNNNISPPIVGLFFASLLFLFPLNKPEKILRSEHITQIDWPSLLLFGSGLSLGSILFSTGLASIMAQTITQITGNLHIIIVISILLFFTIFFTELASNTASANILIPIMIALGQEHGLNISVIALLFALSCNSAFMLPVATPPNAIVYGTNLISKKGLASGGFIMNITCWLIFVFLGVIFL